MAQSRIYRAWDHPPLRKWSSSRGIMQRKLLCKVTDKNPLKFAILSRFTLHNLRTWFSFHRPQLDRFKHPCWCSRLPKRLLAKRLKRRRAGTVRELWPSECSFFQVVPLSPKKLADFETKRHGLEHSYSAPSDWRELAYERNDVHCDWNFHGFRYYAK